MNFFTNHLKRFSFFLTPAVCLLFLLAARGVHSAAADDQRDEKKNPLEKLALKMDALRREQKCHERADFISFFNDNQNLCKDVLPEGYVILQGTRAAAGGRSYCRQELLQEWNASINEDCCKFSFARPEEAISIHECIDKIAGRVPPGCTLLLCKGFSYTGAGSSPLWVPILSLGFYDNTEDDVQTEKDCGNDNPFSWEGQFLCGGRLTWPLLRNKPEKIKAAWDLAKERFRSAFKKDPIVGYIPPYVGDGSVEVIEWVDLLAVKEDQTPWEPKKQAPWKQKKLKEPEKPTPSKYSDSCIMQ